MTCPEDEPGNAPGRSQSRDQCDQIGPSEQANNVASGVTVSVVIPSEVEGPRDRAIGKAAGFLHIANAPVGMTVKLDYDHVV